MNFWDGIAVIGFVVLVIGVLVGYYVGLGVGYDQGFDAAGDYYFLNDRDFWSSYNQTILDNESVYNYDVMRDVILPRVYNDTTTIETSYDMWNETGYEYWVNHSSNYFNSLYFGDDIRCFRLFVPYFSGRVHVEVVE